MDVRVTAIRTIGWITKGDSKIYTYLKAVEEDEKYYYLFQSEHCKVKLPKETWKLE